MDTRHPGHRSKSDSVFMSRRNALQGAALAGASLALLAAGRTLVAPVRAAQQEGPPTEWFAPDATVGGHGQVILGEGPIFLSHLPMFMFENPQNPGSHPHHYQVILEVSLPDDALEVYLADRQATNAPLYTLEPSEAIPMLGVIVPGLTDSAAVQTLNGHLIRGHWERGHEPQAFGIIFDNIQSDVSVGIERIVYAHEFSFDKTSARQLEYVLFGAGDDLHRAHRITAPPDFDQLLPVTMERGVFSDDQLQEGIILAIPERENTIAARLMDGDEVVATARHARTGAALRSDLPITAGREIFFEETELRENGFIGHSQIEIDAGFGFGVPRES